MSEDIFCLIGVVLALIFLAVAVAMIRTAPRPRLFRSMADVFSAWDQANGPAKRLLVLVALFGAVFRGGAAALLALSVMGTAISICLTLCGMSPEALRVVRDIINDVLHWLSAPRRAGA